MSTLNSRKSTELIEIDPSNRQTDTSTVVDTTASSPTSWLRSKFSAMSSMSPENEWDTVKSDRTTTAVIVTSCAFVGAAFAGPLGMTVASASVAGLIPFATPALTGIVSSSLGGLMAGSVGWVVHKVVDTTQAKSKLTESDISDFLENSETPEVDTEIGVNSEMETSDVDPISSKSREDLEIEL